MDVHKSLAGLIFRGVGGIKLKSHCLSCTNCNGACKNVFVVQQLLMDVDKSLAVLIGNSLCASMIVAYAGRLRQNERKMAFEKWRKICDSYKIQVRIQFFCSFKGPQKNVVITTSPSL